MDKCSLCGEINTNYDRKDKNLINSERNANDYIQSLADRLFKFEGYERTVNKTYPIWICEECQESLENFGKLLKVIKRGRKKLQNDEQEYQEEINVYDKDLMDLHNLEKNCEITASILPNRSEKQDVFDDTKEPFKDPPGKRLRRAPKRFLDNNVYFPSKPIKIQKKETNIYLTGSLALLPKIALIRLSTGRLIGQLMEANNYEISSRFRIKCTLCPLVFCFEKDFRTHLKNHTAEMANHLEATSFENFLYYCEICQKSFHQHFAVRRHHKHAHSQERPFQCVHCTASFKYKFNFDYHMAKHLNKRNFKCLLCTKTFVLRYELLIHQRTHTKEKPFKCQFCSISFAHRSNLVTHRRLHTQKKTFNCAMCQATFKSLVYLKKHEKNHGKSKGSQLQTSKSFCRLATDAKNYENPDKFENTNNLHSSNVSLNIANFNTLQSTLMSARLNNIHNNHSKTTVEAKNEDIIVSKTQETTDNGFHGLIFENSLKFSKDNREIPKTNEHYSDMMLSNGKVLKTQTENVSFQIGHTTLKLLPKSQKIEEYFKNKQQYNMVKTNNQNLNVSYKNSKILRSSPKAEKAEYSHYQLQNMEISSHPFEKYPKSPLLKIEVTTNSKQQKSNQFENYTANNGNVSFIQEKMINFQNSTISKNLENQEISFNTSDNNINIKQILNETLNFENSINSSVVTSHPKQVIFDFIDIPTNATDSGNSTKSSNFENLQNSTDINFTYDFNDFCYFKNSPKKNPRSALNQEKLETPSITSSYDSLSNNNMINLKNSAKFTNIEDAENIKITADGNLNAVCFEQNSSDESNNFVNMANSPQNISLLKIKQNPLKINCINKNHDNMTLFNMKSFKIVKFSEDYSKTKLKTISNNNSFKGIINNTTLMLENSPPTKTTNNLGGCSEKLHNSITQLRKLKYFTNNDKILCISPSTSNKLNWDDFPNNPVRKNLYANGFLKSESCRLQSPSMQLSNEEEFNLNTITQSGELSSVATTNLKAIKLQKSMDLSNNISFRTEDANKFQICKILQPLKLVKISTINDSLNIPFGSNTSTKSLSAAEPTENEENKECLKNAAQIEENSINSLLLKSIENQQDLTNNTATNLKAFKSYKFEKSSLNFSPKIAKSYSKLEFNSKPVKLINTKPLQNSSIDVGSTKTIPIQIITNHSTSTALNHNSFVIETSTTASSPKTVTVRKTPVKLKVSSKLNLLKSISNEPVTSLLKPEIILNPHSSSKPQLITNIEILAPFDNTPSTPTAQNLLKQIDEYKFQCHNCWKYFKQKSALKKHLRTHTGEKPYKCNLCPKSYADASNYKKHKILHKNAAEALNITRPSQASPYLPGHPKPHSPTHSTASDPDPDGIEIMKTIKKFGSSSSVTDEDDDDESLSSSSMESFMWQQALDHAMKNDEIRAHIIRNLSEINNSIMPSDMESALHDPVNKSFTCKDPD